MQLDSRDYYSIAQDKYDTTKLAVMCTGHFESNMDFQTEVPEPSLGTSGEDESTKWYEIFSHCCNLGSQCFRRR